MNIYQEKQNLTSQVTCDNPHVKIQKCKDKKKAHTNAIYTYIYTYIYIYIYIYMYIHIYIARKEVTLVFSLVEYFQYL